MESPTRSTFTGGPLALTGGTEVAVVVGVAVVPVAPVPPVKAVLATADVPVVAAITATTPPPPLADEGAHADRALNQVERDHRHGERHEDSQGEELVPVEARTGVVEP